MQITIEKSGFSTIGMYGQNHRLIIINGNPLFYMCTMLNDKDHRVFVIGSGYQISDSRLGEVIPNFSWIDKNIDLLMEYTERKNKIYIYCKTTSGLVVRPEKEAFYYGQPVFNSGFSTNTFDVGSNLFDYVMEEIQKNDDINKFWFVDSITGEVL